MQIVKLKLHGQEANNEVDQPRIRTDRTCRFLRRKPFDAKAKTTGASQVNLAPFAKFGSQINIGREGRVTKY